jgi:tRNA G10  N-methylase Trm11
MKSQPASSTFIFQLGSTPDLSWAELKAVFPNQTWSELGKHLVSTTLETDQLPEVTQWLYHLGGTVKVLALLKDLGSISTDQLPEVIAEELAALGQTKLQFALAEHGRDHLPALEATTIKKLLTDRGLSVRYREGSRLGLSAAILSHHKRTVEFHVIQTPDTILLAQTLITQDIDEWSWRDRGRPYADRKKGMLPPKVSRMMVNLALGQLGIGTKVLNTAEPKDYYLYDPFCGTGTILMETLLSECHAIGSDSDLVACQGTRRNLDWLTEQYHVESQNTVVHADVTKIQPQQLPKPIDAIVTEPFLGKPLPRTEDLPNIFKGLSKLYWGAFRHWTQILKSEGVIVMILPVVGQFDQRYWQEFIDKIGTLGYTMVSEPISYHRPQAVVQRLICTFKYSRVTGT